MSTTYYLSIDKEAVHESNVLADQEFQEEIEDTDVIIRQEVFDDNEYYYILGKFHSGIILLNLPPNDVFAFRGINPSPLGKTKKEMYEQTYGISYISRIFLYASRQMEYYEYGQRFNKMSRRWSFYPDYLGAILRKISRVEKWMLSMRRNLREIEEDKHCPRKQGSRPRPV